MLIIQNVLFAACNILRNRGMIDLIAMLAIIISYEYNFLLLNCTYFSIY
jgi:hypothetical protein